MHKPAIIKDISNNPDNTDFEIAWAVYNSVPCIGRKGNLAHSYVGCTSMLSDSLEDILANTFFCFV